MKSSATLVGILSSCLAASAQVTTSDIPRWYAMIDQLAEARTTGDSLAVVQTAYLDGGSTGLHLFDKARDLSAEHLLSAVRAYPRYYASIRESALAIDAERDSIAAALARVARVLPGFETPEVTIAFGRLNTGGTAVGNHILLGAGMISAPYDADATELSDWHRDQIIPEGPEGSDLRALVAHEAVHVRQSWHYPWAGLVTGVLYEGVCDFVVHDLLDFPAASTYQRFGAAHECEVWRAFVADAEEPRGEAWSRWLYGGDAGRPEWPSDLGYFVGRRIAAAYYARAPDKRRALRTLMNPRRYRRVFRVSGYDGCADADAGAR